MKAATVKIGNDTTEPGMMAITIELKGTVEQVTQAMFHGLPREALEGIRDALQVEKDRREAAAVAG
jgi:microcompartment protein CcmL/EutN